MINIVLDTNCLIIVIALFYITNIVGLFFILIFE